LDITPKSILIVDDELLIRDLLYDFFSERNWQVTVCESADKAMEQLKNRRFELVIVDLKLPESDGISLIGKVKAFFPDLPILIVTGFPSLESAIAALRLKVEDYIVKPFNINKLYKTADSIIENRRQTVNKSVEMT
jgi:DNA-binding response OmpR family regulator